MPPNPDLKDTITKAVLAAAASYIEHRGDERRAKEAVRGAIPSWSTDRVDGFFRRQGRRLRYLGDEFPKLFAEEQRVGAN